jgi:hypothetical protein
MKTVRFEDREWLANEYVLDENDRLIPRDEFEARREFREVLALHLEGSRGGSVRSLAQFVIFAGIVGALAMVLNAIG